ncbi:hypothetical protein HNQ96_001437 [Aminobacter lissarensis]|uniref:Uncharacterized protein n=1 Tax=Aminobacter carboxidus TaxID=376165 RepID=A0A8E2BBX2_9HYPH|nr:hypothetical protein [Aminobacter lissarensis]MBB6465579.1 hypothetical protein [Aminobacter lissarensis]
MLQKNKRHILFFDLVMAPHPSDAPAIELDVLTPFLQARCDAGEAVEVIDAERRIIRLSSMKPTTLANGTPAIAMLFCLGDRDKADTGVTHFDTGAIRIFEKQEGEVGGLSVHAVVSLKPTKEKGHLYRAVLEDVSGFGRTPIQSFLRSQFKIICDDHEFTFPRDDKRPIKTRPMVELTGHASDKLKTSLEEGKLLHIELVDYVEVDFGMDEGKFLKTARRGLNVSVSKALPQGEALKVVEKVRIWANTNGYDTMRVRWKDASSSRPQSAKVDTAKADAGEAFFIKTAEVSFATPLPDICAEMSDELIAEMKKVLT